LQLRYLQNIPVCNYTHLRATVKLLETFLQATLWKPFQLVRRIINYVSSITKAPSLQCWFQAREQVKINCNTIRGNFNYWQVSRIPWVTKHYSPTGRRNYDKPSKRLLDMWDRNGSTSGPTLWQIYDDDELGQGSMGDAPVLSRCPLLRNTWPKATGVLEHCCEGETNCWFSIFRGFSFWPHP